MDPDKKENQFCLKQGHFHEEFLCMVNTKLEDTNSVKKTVQKLSFLVRAQVKNVGKGGRGSTMFVSPGHAKP